jgi:ElaB/YqjD/DUF883 family membrane-anchored ribosome-binding protein
MNTTATPAANASDTRDRVAASLRHMVDEADQLLKAAADAGDEKFDQARIRLEHQLRSLRMQLDELEDKAVYRARQAARRADETVHSHPYGAMGVAAAAGLLIGVLLGRR